MLTHFDSFPSDHVTSRATEEHDQNDGDDHEPENEFPEDGTVFVAYFEDGGDRYADLDPDLIGTLYPSAEFVPSERTVDLAVIVDMLDGQHGYDWAAGSNHWEIRPSDHDEPTGQALIESVLERRRTLKAITTSAHEDETSITFRRSHNTKASQVVNGESDGEDEGKDADSESGADPEDFLEDADTETLARGPMTVRVKPKQRHHMHE
jgi:hypothetical protein